MTETKLFYISFADERDFLGATVVEAEDAEGALKEAHRRRLDPWDLRPDAAAAVVEIDPVHDNWSWDKLRNRLVMKPELERMGQFRSVADLSPEERERLERHTVVHGDDEMVRPPDELVTLHSLKTMVGGGA
jgi:hypothetical protein